MSKKRFIIILSGMVFTILAFMSSSVLMSKDISKGNMIGFLYDNDGRTPLQGAVLQLKNIHSDMLYESSKSDIHGIAKLEGIEPGLYIYGIKTTDGEYNSNDIVGIHAKNTSKISISLKPFDEKTAISVSKASKNKKISGESLIGTVEDFSPESKIATVKIIQGALRNNDKIHIVGEVTDFSQNVQSLTKEGVRVDKAMAEDMASITLDREAQKGDLVYVVYKKGLAPLFLSPLGIATAVAGSGAIVYSFAKFSKAKDKIVEASPFR